MHPAATLQFPDRTAYLSWIRRFILFHGKRHPREMGSAEVEAFLSSLATDRNVAAATQNQALAALLFLYRHVLKQDLPWLTEVVRARKPRRLPLVLTRQETRALLAQLSGVYWLVGNLLYGSGLRLMECLRLRVQDIDFDRSQVMVRNGKGGKDRVTVLPGVLIEPLRGHLSMMHEQHQVAVLEGYGGVELPVSVVHKYPSAATDWGWQYVFPAQHASRDPRTGAWRRHHLMEDSVQRRMRSAVRRAAGEAGDLSYTAALLRHPSAGARVRYPHHPGVAGAFGSGDHADLHPRSG